MGARGPRHSPDHHDGRITVTDNTVDSSAQYEVVIVKYGTRQGHKSEVYLNHHVYGRPDEPIGMDYFVWVIRNAERTIVVDTGFSRAGGDNRNRTFLLQPAEALAHFGVLPEDAPPVLVTHAHYDHIGNLDHFDRSPVTISRAEYEFWTSPLAERAQFHYSVEDAELDALRAAHADGRLRTFDGEIEIAPGVTMRQVGGHTPGQSIVLVDTAEGRVLLASDAVHYYEEYDDDMPFAFVADLPAMYSGFDLIRSLVDSGEVAHVVSGHDPDTLNRFTPVIDGPLAGLAATIGRTTATHQKENAL
jgi:glyoxylase-like metal-dependent hydrolase (beta-lactamase superfamily II)